MPKFHISPEDGEPRRCTASKKPCKYGDDVPHFSSADDARAAYELAQSNIVATVNKKNEKKEAKVAADRKQAATEVQKKLENLVRNSDGKISSIKNEVREIVKNTDPHVLAARDIEYSSIDFGRSTRALSRNMVEAMSDENRKIYLNDLMDDSVKMAEVGDDSNSLLRHYGETKYEYSSYYHHAVPVKGNEDFYKRSLEASAKYQPINYYHSDYQDEAEHNSARRITERRLHEYEKDPAHDKELLANLRANYKRSW